MEALHSCCQLCITLNGTICISMLRSCHCQVVKLVSPAVSVHHSSSSTTILISICHLLEMSARSGSPRLTKPRPLIGSLVSDKQIPAGFKLRPNPTNPPITANQAHHVPSWRPYPPHHPWSGVTHVVDLLFSIGPEPRVRQFPC